jgi:hypothetical protein
VDDAWDDSQNGQNRAQNQGLERLSAEQDGEGWKDKREGVTHFIPFGWGKGQDSGDDAGVWESMKTKRCPRFAARFFSSILSQFFASR